MLLILFSLTLQIRGRILLKEGGDDVVKIYQVLTEMMIHGAVEARGLLIHGEHDLRTNPLEGRGDDADYPEPMWRHLCDPFDRGRMIEIHGVLSRVFKAWRRACMPKSALCLVHLMFT